jgi:LPXTG-motif cell wall-anchored protein
VSATSGDGQAEASTPNAVARSGDPDDQAPVSDTPYDIVDEIDTGDQPLPNTDGAALWVYLMVGAGSLLLLGALIRRTWRAE